MSDISELLERLREGKRSARILWSEISSKVNEEGYVSGQAANLAAVSLETISTYDGVVREQLIKFVSKAVDTEAFMKALAAGLVRMEPALPSLHRDALVAAASALSSVVRVLPLPQALKAASKMCQLLALALSLLSEASTGAPVPAQTVQLLQRKKEAAEELFNAAKNAGLPRALAAIASATRDADLRGKSLDAAVALYGERVLGAKAAPSPLVLASFNPLLATVTAEEFAAKVLPVLSRMLKRTPEFAVPSAGHMASAAAHVPPSVYLGELAPQLVSELKHAKDERRAGAAVCVEGLARASRTSEDLRAVLGPVVDSLTGKGKEAKVKAAAEKASMCRALTLGLRAASRKIPGASDFGLEVVGSLAAVAQEEGVDEVKAAVLEVVGGALDALVPPSAALPQPLVDRLTAGVKEPSRRSHLLLAARCSLRGPAQAAQLAPLLPTALAVIKEGLTKAVLRGEALAALTLVAKVATARVPLPEGAREILAAALKADSPLFNARDAVKLEAQDGAAAASAAGALLQWAEELSRHESQGSVALMLVNLLMASDRRVVGAARRASREAIAAQPQASEALLEAMLSCLDHSPRDVPAWMVNDSDLAQRRVISIRVAKTVAALVQARGGPLPSPRALALGLLAAHHPTATFHTRPLATWKTALRASGNASATTEFMGKSADAICRVLLGAEGLLSSNKGRREAAAAAAGTCLALAPAPFYVHVSHSLRTLLDMTDHDELTKDELAVYRTPPGKLSTERGDASFIPQLFNESAPRARSRFLDGVEITTDMLMEQQSLVGGSSKPANAAAQPVRASIAQATTSKPKQPPAGKPDPREEKRLTMLAEEAVVRRGVLGIKDRIDRGLELVAVSSLAAPRFTCVHLDELSALVLPLLSSPLVGDSTAFHACAALARCLPHPLGPKAYTLTSALRIVQLKETAPPLPERAAIRDSIAVLHAATNAGARPSSLPSSIYRFLFPLAKAILHLPAHSSLHDGAIAFVGLHVAPGQDVPRTETMRALATVMGTVPASRDKVVPMMEALCRGMTEEDLATSVECVLSAHAPVRGAVLRALSQVPLMAEGMCPERDDVVSVLWLACYDVDEGNADIARDVWLSSGAALSPNFVASLVDHLSSGHKDIRTAAARSLADALLEDQGRAGEALGYVILHGSRSDCSVCTRAGCVEAVGAIASVIAAEDALVALDYLLTRALCDPVDWVRALAVESGVSLVDAHGPAESQALMAVLERYLDAKAAKNLGLGESECDLIREGAVVLFGTLARHMTADEGKLKSVVATLLDALSTPSEAVQRAVARCLGPLLARLKGDQAYIQTVIDRLLKTLTTTPRFADRMGAAFGIAGAVRGLGLPSLRLLGIMDTLKAAAESKKSADAREGGLLALGAITESLGRLFEPYVLHILPSLLQSFGDAAQGVREATERCAKAIMAQLTGHGVKLVLPFLLTGLQESAWRSKQGSIQMLGSMAYCAPRQLSTCLPTIVPRLTEVLTDPHPKVQEAARDSLQLVGSTIRNPEVQSLAPTLMAALANPDTHAKAALDLLLDTTFINTIDAASLALIIPVVQRGIQERSGEAKKRAARIMGNMSALINDTKDLQPYVNSLLPELQGILVDPLPDVRASAAKALGSLVAGMGPEKFAGLQPWLMDKLKSENNAVERQGAAQGLAEVIAVMPQHLEELLPVVLAGCSAKSPYIREGHLTLFKYLAISVTDRFQVHLSEILGAIIDGLADEAEAVREAALSAGRTLVDLYAETHLALLLPTVENGVFGESHRIRQSSVELLGDLLFKVSGISGKVQTNEDSDDEEILPGMNAELQGQAIVEILGMERRNEVLSRVYICRSDASLGVRSSALHVWKSVVVNTPKTLTEILPTLMSVLIEGLAQPDEDRREMSGRSLGELVRKMGERVLTKIIPIFQQQIYSPFAATRQGVCSGLREMLTSLTRGQMQEHLPVLLPTIQHALCDEDAGVREQAGAAFSELFKGGASSVIDGVVPSLLRSLESGKNAEEALQGLKVILGVRPQTMNSLMPKLLAEPLDGNKLRAFGQLAPAAGANLGNHLGNALPLLMRVSSDAESPVQADAVAALVALASSIDDDAVHLLVHEAVRALDDSTMRPGAARCLAALCQAPGRDLMEEAPRLIQAVVGLMADEDPATLSACLDAANAITASIPRENQPSFVRSMREAVLTARERQRRKKRAGPLVVPGFAIPKSLAPVLPIYLQGLLQGSSSDSRELAADGLGELLGVTTEEVVKPFVMQIAGPLIRILSEKLDPEIKAAVLLASGLLITKGGVGIKALVPQMQTTFLKCLVDPARIVRMRAAENLGLLAPMVLRADQLAQDLLNSAKQSTQDPGAAEAYLKALQGTLKNGGSRLSAPVLLTVGQTLAQLQAQGGADEDVVRDAVASCLGTYMACCPEEDALKLLNAGPLNTAPAGKKEMTVRALLLAAGAKHSGPRLLSMGLSARLGEAIAALTKSCESRTARVAVARALRDVVVLDLTQPGVEAPGSVLPGATPSLLVLLGHDQAEEVQRAAMQALRAIARCKAGALEAVYPSIIPSLCALAQSGQGAAKARAEVTLGEVLHMNHSGSSYLQALLASGQAGALARQFFHEGNVRKISKAIEEYNGAESDDEE